MDGFHERDNDNVGTERIKAYQNGGDMALYWDNYWRM